MADWKLVKHGELGCKSVEYQGAEAFIRFAFNEFKSKRKGHYTELFNADGHLIATIPADHIPDPSP